MPNGNDSQIANAHLRRRPHTVPGFRGETQNPGAGVVDINLGITGMNCLQRNAIPSTEFNKVLDR